MNIEHAVRHALIIQKKILQKQSKPQWEPAAEGEALKIFIVAFTDPLQPLTAALSYCLPLAANRSFIIFLTATASRLPLAAIIRISG